MKFLNEQMGVATDAPRHAVIQVGSNPPTDEQVAIIDAAINTHDNLLINALAGAAKTSTLVMIANQPSMQKVSTLCVAFNKKIQLEMQERLPSNCVAMTLHSLGVRVWGQAIGRKSNINFKKTFQILDELLKKERKDVQDEVRENFADLMKMIGAAKNAGFVPEASSRVPTLRMFASDNDYFLTLDEEPPHAIRTVFLKAMIASIERAFNGEIDFDDMIFMPVVFPAKFPQYPLTMVDESQDLSSLNHAMLEQMVGNNRLFAVGDPFQAIYGFRGAHESSMSLLKERFSMKEMNLTTSFRCPTAVVQAAQWRAPLMKAPTWAKVGEVKERATWSVEDLPQDAVIICRNNAPLYRTAIRLLMNGRFPQLIGNDIGKTILKTLKKIGDGDMNCEAVYEAIDVAEMQKLSRAREHAKDSVRDFFACLRLFVPRGDTLNDIIAYADYIINTEGPIRLMTGHKSKGLEFHNVFILDQHLCKLDQPGQDRNVLYVMQTRSQENLTYIYSDGFISNEPEGSL
jgi:DNA helicase-2/ATP-dependent DNA helicase PcrA